MIYMYNCRLSVIDYIKDSTPYSTETKQYYISKHVFTHHFISIFIVLFSIVHKTVGHENNSC